MKTVSLNSEDLLPLIEETLKLNSSFNLKVKGNSMRPFLRNDLSKVLLEKMISVFLSIKIKLSSTA